ncbi:SDR family oxidoreductase [Stenotrophomonas sp. ZAC14D2_NAIMI4_7]|uniref:SDR family oxidoreductase n=1 Tax=Stenotrophomonas sp. ZAC14D2_NAIMI4_7 TaxID=2072405 RepID=UPI0022792CF0|nr:SDR family oxidoreductase [Stenotrophomonas sp. ZAC14D2_NAIMI4_7]
MRRVRSVAPGAIETDFFGGAVRDDAAVNHYGAQHTAMVRAGRPDGVGKAVAILLAASGRSITGQRIQASEGCSSKRGGPAMPASGRRRTLTKTV